ncbi:MAG: dihydrodipicolinate synthase family protein [Pirellulales bacterium]|nr:dihydrodipicolinate synthase family protein [Pirellulales bacterium]
MRFRLTGLTAATHTPFDAAGELNLSVVEKQAEHLMCNGIHVAFIGGTTGECHSLSLEERLALTERWMAVARGTPLWVIVHAGSNCLSDAKALAAQAQKLGACAIASLPPCYFKPKTMETVVACSAEVAAAAPGLPFYYYDIPALSTVNFSMVDYLEIAAEKIPNFGGVKFSNADLVAYQRCLHSQNGRFDLPWGVDELLLAALAFGAAGAVGSSYNFMAARYHRLMAAFNSGDLVTARKEQLFTVEIIFLLIRYGYIAAAKAVMEMLGVPVGPARLPQRNLTPGQIQELREELETLGFFN